MCTCSRVGDSLALALELALTFVLVATTGAACARASGSERPIDQFISQGLRHNAEGNYDAACEVWNRMREFHPDHPAANVYAADTLYWRMIHQDSDTRYDVAIQHECEEAIRKAESWVGTHSFFQLCFLCEKTLLPVADEPGYELEMPRERFAEFMATAGPILSATCAVLKLVTLVGRPVAKIAGIDLPQIGSLDMDCVRDIKLGESTVGEAFELDQLTVKAYGTTGELVEHAPLAIELEGPEGFVDLEGFQVDSKTLRTRTRGIGRLWITSVLPALRTEPFTLPVVLIVRDPNRPNFSLSPRVYENVPASPP